MISVAGCGSSSTKATEKPSAGTALPKQMTWSNYDVGSSGYVQVGAIANALTNTYGTSIRMLPSGTSVGRLMPLKSGEASYGFLGDEVYFASEGLYEFASAEWGPQDLRVILQHPETCGMVTTADSGIKTVTDIKGKRVPYVPGAPTLYVKTEALLAFANLTWNDVQKVELPSYAASLKALLENKVDVTASIPTASVMYEIASSPRGIKWLEIPAADKEGWARLHKVAPWLYPDKEDRGAGLKQGQPLELVKYGYPQVVTYASRSADEVYALIKAFDETFNQYKDASPVMPDWAIDKAARIPAGAPYHEGAIKYLKEKGLWTAKMEAWNNEKLKRLQKVQEAWKTVLKEADAKGIAKKDFPAYWMKRRQELVGS